MKYECQLQLNIEEAVRITDVIIADCIEEHYGEKDWDKIRNQILGIKKILQKGEK